VYNHTQNDKKEPKEHHYTATLRYTSPHFTQLHFATLHYNTQLHLATLHPTTIHYTSLHSTTPLHYTSLHFTTFHPTTLHYTYRHFTTLSFSLTHLHFLSFYFTSHHYTRHSTVLISKHFQNNEPLDCPKEPPNISIHFTMRKTCIFMLFPSLRTKGTHHAMETLAVGSLRARPVWPIRNHTKVN
jgi:hypothetical protein